MIALQRKVLAALDEKPRGSDEIALAIGAADEAETVFHILEHLAANPDRGIRRTAGATPTAARYGRELSATDH